MELKKAALVDRYGVKIEIAVEGHNILKIQLVLFVDTLWM